MKRLVTLFAFVLVSLNGHAAQTADALNLRFDPIGVLLGAVGLTLDFPVHPNWTLGPQLTFWNPKIPSNDGYSYRAYVLGGGVRANWFKNGVFTDGLYVGPSMTYARTTLKVTGPDVEASYEGSSTLLVGVVGYAWYWDSFNIHLGGGAAMNVGDGYIEVKNRDGERTRVNVSVSSLTAEFSLGFTF